MVFLASVGLSWPPMSSSSWPRMQSGQKNPFQNAPGAFIYALPNLAGACPFSQQSPSDNVLFCSFSGAEDSINDAPSPDPHHRPRCYHDPVVNSRSHRHDALSECAEPPTAPTEEEGAPPDTESPQSLPPLPPSPSPRTSTPLSASDESHFCLGDIDISFSPLTEGGPEEPGQQELHGSSELASVLSTSTPTSALTSPTGLDFQDGSKEEEGEGEGEEKKEKEKGQRRSRKRGGKRPRARRQPRNGGGLPPRFQQSGAHNGLRNNDLCPQAPPFLFPTPHPPHPQAMNYRNAWTVAGYHHHQDHRAFGVPAISPAAPRQFWTAPTVLALGFVGALPAVAC